MKKINRIYYSISTVVLGLSVVCWLLLLLNSNTIKHCPVTVEGPSQASFVMLLEMNPISALMMGWVLMVLAMMLPKLILPITHIYQYSLKRKRFSASVVFILGYVLVWSVAGLVTNMVILGFNILMPFSYIPALVVGIIMVLWQFSPIKQYCLNFGHQHHILSTFGWATYRDAFRFGLKHGAWCVGSGWAMMLFPMLLQEWHNVAMLFVTFLMISEHLEHPKPPRWYFDLRLKLLRIIIAQTKIRLMKRA